MNIIDKYRPVFAPEDGAGAPSGAADGGSGGTSPAASTTPQDAGAPSSPGPTEGFVSNEKPDNVDDLMNLGALDDDLEEVAEPPTPKPPVAKGAAAQPDKTPPVIQPPGTSPQPAAAPTAQPQAPGPQEAATATPTPAEPTSFPDLLDQHRGAMIEEISKKLFPLSKELADSLELDVVGTMPKLGAQVYYESVKATLNHIARFEERLPQLIQRHLDAVKESDETTKAFYGQFKALDKGKHDADVRQFALAFRAANPRITKNDLWAMTASAVMSKYGLAAPPVAANGRAPARSSAQQPFVPATPGTTVRTTPDKPEPWAGLGMEFDDD